MSPCACASNCCSTLIADIVVDVDDEVRDVVLTIHWKGGQHSELRVRKPQSGEHGCATTEDALAVMRSRQELSDEISAASLNRNGYAHGSGKNLDRTPCRFRKAGPAIHAYKSADKEGEWLTMTEAAATLGVTNHRIRHLIKTNVLSAEQVFPARRIKSGPATWLLRRSKLR